MKVSSASKVIANQLVWIGLYRNKDGELTWTEGLALFLYFSIRKIKSIQTVICLKNKVFLAIILIKIQSLSSPYF